jgi:uncharacterized protein (TIGR04255 family)
MGNKLTHAPLFLTVAEVRFNAILSLDSYVPAIQERLRKQGYVDYQEAEVVSFTVNVLASTGPTQLRAQRHVFMDMDKRAAFVLTQSTLSFHTSKYEVFETFVRDLMNGIAVIHELMTLSFIDRIGIRYLDAVLPRDNERLDQYLVPEVLGLRGKLDLDGESDQTFSQTRIALSKGHLLARCLIRMGPVGVPADLNSVDLQLEERFARFHGWHALLDTDAAHEERQPFSLANIQSLVYVLHKHIGKAFTATVTNHARDVWK